jgi:hypothetical protein
MRNLELRGLKRLTPEVAGSNPAPRTELASVRANGTIRVSATPQKPQQKNIVYHVDASPIHIPASKEFCLGMFKSLVMGKVDGSVPNLELMVLENFDYYLKDKVSEKVRYEYMRVVKHFLKETYGIKYDIIEPRFVEKLKEFLNIENPYTYRNTLAGLKHFFAFLGISEYLQDFKFRASMPNFSIATPSFKEMLKFHDAIENDRIRFFFELGTVSAIRPEHLTRLTKKLFDKQNRMINTWQKVFSKKNFFFSFYPQSLAPRVEAYLDSLPKPDSQLFPMCNRYIQKEFVKASEKSGVSITPKMLRKFAAN